MILTVMKSREAAKSFSPGLSRVWLPIQYALETVRSFFASFARGFLFYQKPQKHTKYGQVCFMRLSFDFTLQFACMVYQHKSFSRLDTKICIIFHSYGINLRLMTSLIPTLHTEKAKGYHIRELKTRKNRSKAFFNGILC